MAKHIRKEPFFDEFSEFLLFRSFCNAGLLNTDKNKVMTRTIKFRAKAINDGFYKGEWVYGYYMKSLCGGELVDVITDGANEMPIQVDTLGQFSGVLDKNGVEVCEGDIISFGNALLSKFPVECKYGCFGYSFCGYHPIEGVVENDYHDFESDECLFEVVGNIFDNKELIE